MKRETLTPERIAAEALALIDQVGLEEFSTRKLGAALGVEAMSLYHHFPSKGHVLDAVADLLMAQVDLPEAPADDPVERLRQTVRNYRTVARAHPNAFLLIAARRFNTPRALAFLEGVLALLQNAGLAPDRAARYFRMVGYFLNGALLSELTVLGQRPDPTGAVVDTGVPPGLPATARSAPFLGAAHLDATFDEGLEAILTRLQEEIDRTRS